MEKRNYIRCNLRSGPIGHVRYINILTWLRGFQVKLLYLVLFSLYPSLFWELRDKRNLKNLQFWPESLGAMLEYWYIERGLLYHRSYVFLYVGARYNRAWYKVCGCLPFVRIIRLGRALINGKGFSKISKPTERNGAYHLQFDFPSLFSAD